MINGFPDFRQISGGADRHRSGGCDWLNSCWAGVDSGLDPIFMARGDKPGEVMRA